MSNIHGAQFTTRAGCVVKVERVGQSVGVTIHPVGGKPMLYVCGADEAAVIAALLAPQAVREARAAALEEAAADLEARADASADPPIAYGLAGPMALRARAARERKDGAR